MVQHDLDDVFPDRHLFLKLLNTNQQSRDLAILWTKGIGVTPDPFGAGAYNL